MPKRIVALALVLALVGGGAVWWARRDRGQRPYTGFVEGEERVIRSEVSGRVLAVPFVEGQPVPPGGVLARLDDADVLARIAAKRAEITMLAVQIDRQAEQVTLVEQTWTRDRAAREADVARAASAVERAERSWAREADLVRTGASTAQRLDDERAARDQARSTLAAARAVLERTLAEERQIALARQQRDVLVEQRRVAEAQLAELEVQQAKFTVRAPDTPTVVQTQLVWPGELAQPGTPVVEVLDPRDKYVQLYVPVDDVAQFRIGRRVEIELDSQPGVRVPGEISFVADSANFTPEKIETRRDRMGQVYRAKVRILEGVERFQPGTEGDVWLTPEPSGR